MKLEYEAWSRQLQLVSLIQYGILKTLQQKMALSCYRLKELVKDPKYNKQHRLFSKNDESDEVVRDKPDEAKLIEHVRIMSYQIKTGFLKEYFVEEHKKAIERQNEISTNRFGIRLFLGSQESYLHASESYGNILYEFCHYRSSLKDFHKRCLWIRRVHSIGKMAYDVTKAFNRDSKLPQTQEFYREYNYIKF